MKDIVVIGLGAFGFTVAKELSSKKMNVLVIDKDEEKVENISDSVMQAIIGDATDIEVLKNAGVQNFETAIVSVGDDIPSSIIITLNLKELGLKQVIAKAMNDMQARALRRVGADKIVFPERDSALKLAESIANPSIFEHIELSPDYGLMEVKAPRRFLEKTLSELDVRKEYGVNVIAIKRPNVEISEEGKTIMKENVIIAPSGNEKIKEGDIIVVVGRYEDLDKINRL
uniref:TrkA family potassium uptake protein n=1 Tax=candidate division WOR-3 bacterium TaxID=2052148 RepID=A0A7C4YI62_UNCW3